MLIGYQFIVVSIKKCIFAKDKAALGNLKTSFHCARLHNLYIINKYIE